MNLKMALHMNTEEHKGNEGKNLRRLVAHFPIHHRGERLQFVLPSKIGYPRVENALFPSFASVQLLFLG
jgi:hypothetical protein